MVGKDIGRQQAFRRLGYDDSVRISLGLRPARNICCFANDELVRDRLAGVDPDARMVQAFEEMGSRAEEMIRVAVDSFVERDVEAASLLVDLDELIDRFNTKEVQPPAYLQHNKAVDLAALLADDTDGVLRGLGTSRGTVTGAMPVSACISKAARPTPSNAPHVLSSRLSVSS